MKSCKHIRSLIGFLFLINPIVYSQTDFHFHHLTTSNGLPDNSVNDLFQDHQGYLWFCTDDGLMKFDGTKTIVYRNKRDDASTISNSTVACTNEDHDGNIWVGTQSGLDRINCKDGSITRFDTLSGKEILRGQQISAIAVNYDGTVWIGTGAGLFKYAIKENHFEHVLQRQIINRPGVLASVCHKGIVFDSKGNIYVGLAGSIYISRDNGKSFGELNLHHQTIIKNGEVWLSCLKIINDELWYADWGYPHIYRRDLKTGEQKEYVFNQTKFCEPSEVINDVCPRNKNELWLGCVQGVEKASTDVFILNIQTGAIQKINPKLNAAASLISGESETVLQDRQNTMWIAGTQGVDYYNPEFSNFKAYASVANNIRSYQGGKVTSIVEDNQNRVWVGSRNGLSCFNDSSYEFIHHKIANQFSRSDSLNTIHTLFADHSGLLWISTKGGVIQFNTKTNAFIRNEKDNSIKRIYFGRDTVVVCFAEDHSGNIWMGLWQSGILKYDIKTGKLFKYSKVSKDPQLYIPHEWSSSLTVDSSNNLWIGYNDYGGFAKWNLPKGKLVYYPPETKKLSDPTVNKILAVNNRILFATNCGLTIVDPHLKTIKIIGSKEGLPSDRIDGIMQAPDQTFWVTSSFGLSHISVEKNQIQNYYTRELNSQFNSDVFCITAKKQILSGSDSALILFSIPQKPDTFSYAPAITSFKVNGVDFPQFNQAKSIKLEYWQNNFSFEFSSMNFIDPQTDHFSYRLDGYDKNWIDASDRRFINYTNIPGGNYTFKVKVQKANGVWTDIAATQPLKIATAFYNAGWFYMVCIIILFAIAYALYRYKVNQFLALQKVRQKISADLHDDIGSTLSSITLMSAVAKKKIITQPEEAITLAEKMEDASRQMITTMSDIVWSIKPGNDTLEQLISRLREYMHNMMENRVKTYCLTMDEHVLNTAISINLRRDIYLIGKEIINNASKYAEADCFTMLFTIKNNHLLISAADSGKGFDESTIKKGNGINNIYQRIKKHNGVCKCESSAGKGTTWLVKISLSS